MDSEGPERQYLDWLYGQIASSRDWVRARSYRRLAEQMQGTIFVAVVSYDENRISDAKELRYEFLAEREDVQGDLEWMRSSCTMLELFMILSRRLSFETDDDLKIWFWHLIEMLNLERFNDRVYDEQAQEIISDALDRVIWRTYEPSGHGGLFPLNRPGPDQRNVELWYQLNAYLQENF